MCDEIGADEEKDANQHPANTVVCLQYLSPLGIRFDQPEYAEERLHATGWRVGDPPHPYSPAQRGVGVGGGLLPAFDQDSLEREALISIWGIGTNV